jgi:hypothetical protein
MKKTLKKGFLGISLLGLLFTQSVVAQEETTTNPADTLASAIEAIQSDLSILKKLKITGYLQAQWQKADTIGSVAGFSGGNFTGTNNRFMVRRGRIKFAYTNELSNYVLQFDVSEKGFAIKDAYLSFTDPWYKAATLTGGVFNRPFGFEIEYSSSSRETPERSRIFQTLFPGERDLGAKLTLQAPKTSSWNFLKLDAGLFNGNGESSSAFSEVDKYKDFIGHLSANKTFFDETLSVGLGASYYDGGFALPKSSATGAKLPHVYKLKDVAGTETFVADSAYAVGDKAQRQYWGFDAQASLSTPAGLTTLRGEYIAGKQSAFKSIGNTTSPTTTFPSTDDVYVRDFSGGYVYFIQSILNTKHEVVAKYDWYDPNTKVSGNQIGLGGTSAADIKYSTLGLGWIYHWNTNVKITLYYEMVTNEKTNASSLAYAGNGTKTFAKDQKDNVFTFRIQYKF